jgi:hypothetical protein
MVSMVRGYTNNRTKINRIFLKISGSIRIKTGSPREFAIQGNNKAIKNNLFLTDPDKL